MYGRWRRQGLLAYAIGFFASLPFGVIPDVTTGPAASLLVGVDVGWLVGIVVTGSAYLIFTRTFDLAAEASAIAESKARLALLER